MTLKLITNDAGEKIFIRPPYRPQDYTAPASAIDDIRTWNDHSLEEILTLPEANMGSYRLVDRYERDGKAWRLYYHVNKDEEFCLEIEDKRGAIEDLEIRPVPPERAYAIIRGQNHTFTFPVIDQGTP
jgi:hypothetical protein